MSKKFGERYFNIFILAICLLTWILSVKDIQINKLQPTDFGPFQYFPFFFWPSLIIVCYLNLIPDNKNNKILSMLLLGFMTLGTLSIIEPFGRMTDSWQNVALSKIIFQGGNLDYGQEYIRSYPLLFLFLGALQEITYISVGNIVRFTPLIMMIGYLFGTILVIKVISSLFEYNNNEIWSIASISFLFLVVFGLSLLGLRINPAPQSMASVLFLYIIFIFFRNGIEWRFLFVLLTLELMLIHFITPPTMFFAFLCFLFGYSMYNRDKILKNKYNLSRMMLPFSVFFVWCVYVSTSFFKNSILQFENLIYLENMYNIETVGSGLPSNELLTTYRQISMIIVGFILIYAFFVLLQKKKDLGISIGLFCLALSPGYILYIFQSDFGGRILQLSILPTSLLFGFGIFEILKTKKYTSYIVVFLILAASLMSIITSNNGDIYEGISYPDITGSKFVVDYTDTDKLVYHSRLATDDYSNVWYTTPLIPNVNKDLYRIILNLKDKIIVISDRWIYRQMYIEKKEENSIKRVEENFTRNINVNKLYNNGNFRIYAVS